MCKWLLSCFFPGWQWLNGSRNGGGYSGGNNGSGYGGNCGSGGGDGGSICVGDECLGPRISQSFIIFAFSAIKKNA